MFYLMSNIPEGTQDNPFNLYMDKNSVLRSFSSVFDIDDEEIAIRFYSLFVEDKIDRANEYNPTEK